MILIIVNISNSSWFTQNSTWFKYECQMNRLSNKIQHNMKISWSSFSKKRKAHFFFSFSSPVMLVIKMQTQVTSF